MITAFIIVATSSDQFIARNDAEKSTKWTSKEDRARFIELTKRARVVVMGSKTFATMENKGLKGRLNIIYSRTKNFDSSDPERPVETTSDEPAVLLKKLEDRGYTEVAVCGGTEIYTVFMKAGVVDKIYQTIEPATFGSGIPMFSGIRPELKEKNRKELPTGTIFIDWLVVNKK